MGLTLEPSGDTANKMLHSKRLKILAAHLFGCKNKCVFLFRSTKKKRANFVCIQNKRGEQQLCLNINYFWISLYR